MINHSTLLMAETIPLIEWLAPALMVAGLLLLLVIAVQLARRPQTATPKPTTNDDLQTQEFITARQDLEDERQRVAELIGVAQRLASKSDDKAALLNQLITQADERLALLRDTLSSGMTETKPAAIKCVSTTREPDEPHNEVELVIVRTNAGQKADA